MPAGEVKRRAESFRARLTGLDALVEGGESVIGGGSTPEQSISTWLVVIACPNVTEVERRLRTGEPAVSARIENDRLALDLRTVFPEEEDDLAAGVGVQDGGGQLAGEAEEARLAVAVGHRLGEHRERSVADRLVADVAVPW